MRVDHANSDSAIAANALAGALFLFASGLGQYASLSHSQPDSAVTLRKGETRRFDPKLQAGSRYATRKLAKGDTEKRQAGATSSTAELVPGDAYSLELSGRSGSQPPGGGG